MTETTDPFRNLRSLAWALSGFGLGGWMVLIVALVVAR